MASTPTDGSEDFEGRAPSLVGLADDLPVLLEIDHHRNYGEHQSDPQHDGAESLPLPEVTAEKEERQRN